MCVCTQGDMLARMMTHSEMFEVKATVTEVAVHCSGRRPPLLAPGEVPRQAPTGPVSLGAMHRPSVGLGDLTQDPALGKHKLPSDTG